MNLNEILKAKNLGDDVIQSIFDDMKANGIYLSSEENIDIRYGKLKTQHEGVTKERDEARATLEELQKAAKGQENLQQIIKDHEQREEQLQAELEQTKIEAEIKVGLLAEKALDVDYLTFKLKEKGELALDENGKIKGWDDKMAALKTQLPNQFESAATRKVIENRLPEGDNNAAQTPKTLEEALKMQYEQKN
ncbi:MAG: phage scaffolding protein [Clostridia bacterium]|nr:phage scaffolding protein [Clostridia bacterium]